MVHLPLTARFTDYRGSKDNLRRKATENAVTARRIADHVNGLIANNPDDVQQYFFASIAHDLGVSDEDVRSAISDGGYNGMTLRVTEYDRRELARYLK
jgi:hypothetical protein